MWAALRRFLAYPWFGRGKALIFKGQHKCDNQVSRQKDFIGGVLGANDFGRALYAGYAAPGAAVHAVDFS
jgi:phosphatidylethanolamine-binding protein (PEBP) family uncharacterized protein